MSCSTLNQSAVRMEVSIGALPEGYCPDTMQDLADAFATRLIVTPNQNFTSFATGSVAPTSNVGPWFKDCIEWFVWDDATASYIPITKGGFDNQQYILASGNFVVPEFIYKLRVTLWGAGGGGHAANGGGGGGGGGFTRGIFNVQPFQVIPFVIGTGGASGSPATDGGDSTFLTMTSGGGKKGVIGPGGLGGTATGGDMNLVGGHGNEGFTADPGVGGNSPQGGQGGVANSNSSVVAANGVVPGGGGVGQASSSPVAGAGAAGAILLEW